MDRITFWVNGEFCSAGSEVDSDETLNDYLRKRLNLRGTKYMCKEGVCGACIVVATAPDHNGFKRTLSVNSCLILILQCQDWEITTIEGIGDRQRYHPIQRRLAEYNGSQCGYCSPGWVMSMYGLLESRHYDLNQEEIENSFGSNNCRCTGYRSILDAFKSFAKDAPNPKLEDIEDLAKFKSNCKDWCFVTSKQYKKIPLKDGIIPIFEFPQVLIDISAIEELKTHYIDQNLVIGAGTTITDFMGICKKMAETDEDFSYTHKFYEHLDKVAHIPVRNVRFIYLTQFTSSHSKRFYEHFELSQ
ncbi:xanthine dehydrogenase/oxidase-like [Pieris brassicae]|uniref:xanthine dehydrogenase/oxidase-like n=1 Tax=Pieris brassicae TaxID=7116 RepID=UPI001E65EF61|nr:xanthine dehydrogenase/oxidase-like [Pieris brassicae]